MRVYLFVCDTHKVYFKHQKPLRPSDSERTMFCQEMSCQHRATTYVDARV